MRAERLLSLVLFLQSRRRVTAAEVAAELEVSVATARRDLEALSAAGVPVYAQAGRHGGWELIGGARTDLSGFSSSDARALFWLLGTAGLSGQETWQATRKLLRALPRTLREEAETLATSIHHDHREWGSAGSGTDTDLDRLRAALVTRREVSAYYASRSGQRRARVLRPLGLVAKAGEWYLVAGTAEEACAEARTYRVSRLEDVELRESTFHRPADFDLAAHWHAHTEEVERLRSGVSARLRVPRWVAPLIQRQFGRHVVVLGPAAGAENAEEILLEVRAHLLVALAEQLAGWGDRITVLSPPELREELVRIGGSLSAHHGDC